MFLTFVFQTYFFSIIWTLNIVAHAASQEERDFLRDLPTSVLIFIIALSKISSSCDKYL